MPVTDERGLLAINYTSGTTGRPKGVMYHHRGANLQALAMAFHMRLEPASRYLWTLPMFHCDGWCFPWAVTAAGGLHVCLRVIDAEEIWRLIRTEGVTHYCAAPTVLTMIAHAEAAKDGPAPGARHRRDGRRPAVADAARAHERAGHVGHPPLRAHRDLRSGRRERLAPRVGRPRRRRAVAAQGAPGRRQRRRAAPAGARRADRRRGPVGRRDDGRARAARQRRDARVLPGPRGDRGGRTRTAGSAPGTSASSTPTATSRSATAART